MAVVSRMGLPLSRVSTMARCSALASIRSAIRSIMAERSVGVVFFQEQKAFLAASTARSTSSGLASTQVARASPLAGLVAVKVLPPSLSTHFPLMKSL